MTAVAFGLGALVSYLLGSIPTGYLLAKPRGVDIRAVGSGNIGATNVMRALGRGPGLLVLFLDALKGWLPVFLAPRVFPEAERGALQMICCLAAIAGHNWTFWLRFKGGKGVATTAGALLGCLPAPLLAAAAVWGVVFGIGRYVSLASICAAIALPVATALIVRESLWIVFTTALAVIAIWKHRANIQRLRAGTEHRVGARQR